MQPEPRYVAQSTHNEQLGRHSLHYNDQEERLRRGDSSSKPRLDRRLIRTPTCQLTLAADLFKTLQMSPWHHLLGLNVPKSLMSTQPQ